MTWTSLPCGTPDALNRPDRQRWETALHDAHGRAEQARRQGNDHQLAAALHDQGTALNRLGRPRDALGVLLESVAYLGHDPHGQARSTIDVCLEVDAQRYATLWLDTVSGGMR